MQGAAIFVNSTSGCDANHTCTLNIYRSNFDSNFGNVSGAIHSTTDSLSVQVMDSNFTNNKATTGRAGCLRVTESDASATTSSANRSLEVSELNATCSCIQMSFSVQDIANSLYMPLQKHSMLNPTAMRFTCALSPCLLTPTLSCCYLLSALAHSIIQPFACKVRSFVSLTNRSLAHSLPFPHTHAFMHPAYD